MFVTEYVRDCRPFSGLITHSKYLRNRDPSDGPHAPYLAEIELGAEKRRV